MSYLTLDIGGTFIKYALMDSLGNIIKQNKVQTPLTTQKDFLNSIQEILINEHEAIQGIACSLPGTIDANSGFVFQGGTLKYNSMTNLKEIMEQTFQMPVTLENDAHCAALAELWRGNLLGVQNGMVLTFGTGIGGCLIINGMPYKGTHLFAGEVSILLTKSFSQYGMDAIWGPQGSPTKFIKRICNHKQIEIVDGSTAFQWIADKEEPSYRMFQEYCKEIAQQLYNFQILLDPQRICIGGGVSVNPIFVKGIQEAMSALYALIPIDIPKLEIVPCKFHNNSNLLGAFYHFMNQQKKGSL